MAQGEVDARRRQRKDFDDVLGHIEGVTFQPDIIVTGPDGVTLVVEAKTTLPNLEQAEEQLSHYMLGMHCPTGILVTPKRMWVYRDLYASPPVVARVGEFDMSGMWKQEPPQGAHEFELFVQEWLEHVSHHPTKDLPFSVQEALRNYVLPAVAGGDLRAAHPRYS